MAAESSEMEKASEEAASDTPSSSSPILARLEEHKRAQRENMSHMAKIVDILERARNNLKELERQRLSHLEGLRKLRTRLSQQNKELRLTAAAMSGSSDRSPGPASSLVLPGSSRSVSRTRQLVDTADNASVSSYPRKRSSSKSVSIATTPSKSLSLATSEAPPPPRASSSRSLHRKGSQRSCKRIKHRMLTSGNEESVSAISEESEQSATARGLKQRLLSNFKYLN